MVTAQEIGEESTEVYKKEKKQSRRKNAGCENSLLTGNKEELVHSVMGVEIEEKKV